MTTSDLTNDEVAAMMRTYSKEIVETEDRIAEDKEHLKATQSALRDFYKKHAKQVQEILEHQV